MVHTRVKKVVIYCRVSTNDQSCERQERDLRAFAERLGNCEIVEVYKESASGAKNDRAKRNLIMKLAQARKIDAILVTEMSRWGRSLPDLLSTLDELKGFGVSVMAVSGLQFDMTTANGKMLASVLGALAEFERDLLIERVKSGMENAKANGKVIGRPAGVHSSDKHKDAVMKHIEEGRSIRWIAHELQLSKTTVVEIKKRATA